MKKYLSGLLGLGLAIGAFAFTNETKMINGKKVVSDPCAQSSKIWWIINLECNQQTSLAIIRTPENYSQALGQEGQCSGSQCVCAIFACPTTGGGSPVISSGTTIYTALANFYNSGSTSPTIMTKDPYVGR